MIGSSDRKHSIIRLEAPDNQTASVGFQAEIFSFINYSTRSIHRSAFESTVDYQRKVWRLIFIRVTCSIEIVRAIDMRLSKTLGSLGEQKDRQMEIPHGFEVSIGPDVQTDPDAI